jgi:predicted O-methyltransferase YrrM
MITVIVLLGVLIVMVIAVLIVLLWRLDRLATATGERFTRMDQALTERFTRVDPAVAERFTRIDTKLRALRGQVEHDAIKLQRGNMRELEGLHQLFGGFTPRAPMPPTGHWALNPTDLLALLHLVERRQPAVVVELGSGTSTVWMAYAVERYGGRIISLDHDPEFAQRTRTMLRTHGLDAVADVRDAALLPVTIGDAGFDWYDLTALSDVDSIDLLLVDGPPGSTGPLSRYPALPLLRARLAPGATVVLDDTSRADERETLRRWLAEDASMVAEPVTAGQHAVLSSARRRAPAQRIS